MTALDISFVVLIIITEIVFLYYVKHYNRPSDSVEAILLIAILVFAIPFVCFVVIGLWFIMVPLIFFITVALCYIYDRKIKEFINIIKKGKEKNDEE